MRSLSKAWARLNLPLVGLILAADDVEVEVESTKPKFFYGGQAVMEGVMMRSAYSAAIAVRSPKRVAIGGYDPVAYFDAGKAAPGSEAFEHKWADVYWRFTSEASRDAFAEEPSKYAPQYGGHCAGAMRQGERAAPDPEVWATYDGKLYLFEDAAARAAWMEDPAAHAAQAGAQWEAPNDKPAAAEGEVVVHEEPLSARIYRGALPKIPLLRGLIMLWDALVLGSRALMWSADVALSEEEDESGEKIDVSFSGALGIGTLLFSLVLGIGLFMVLPAGIAKAIEQLTGMESAVLINVVEGLVRLALVIGYIWVIGRVPDIRRLFQYHGAEHKVINAYEGGAPLTPEAADRYPLEHPRCGTGFLLVVVVVSVFVFAFLGHSDNLLWRFGSRVLLVPVVAGIAYEWIRFAAANQHRALVRALIQPNLWLQHLTTNPPTHKMLEVSITALERVLHAEPTLAPAEVEAETEPEQVASMS
ncbi:MAG: DUF1385 domain-containing protein [Anaerolineae bacterium]|nr:DUF1385 domain-containing protein [Anaerolineae bacterium]